DTLGRAGDGLLHGVVLGRHQVRTALCLLRPVVPEPVLTRLVRADDGMAGRAPVRGRVRGWRAVAAAHVATRGTPSQVVPPATALVTLDAAGAARRHGDVDGGVTHDRPPLSGTIRHATPRRTPPPTTPSSRRDPLWTYQSRAKTRKSSSVPTRRNPSRSRSFTDAVLSWCGSAYRGRVSIVATNLRTASVPIPRPQYASPNQYPM